MSGNANLKKGTNRKRKNKDGKDDMRTKRSKNSDLPPSGYFFSKVIKLIFF